MASSPVIPLRSTCHWSRSRHGAKAIGIPDRLVRLTHRLHVPSHSKMEIRSRGYRSRSLRLVTSAAGEWISWPWAVGGRVPLRLEASLHHHQVLWVVLALFCNSNFVRFCVGKSFHYLRSTQKVGMIFL